MNKEDMKEGIERYIKIKYGKKVEDALEYEIFNGVSLTLLEIIIDKWNNTSKIYEDTKNAYYFSSEFLMGRTLGNNLMNLNLYKEVKEVLNELNVDINKIEEVEEDAGLGNGGLGRLAACFMDSAATLEIPLNGYGIRYSNGLFNQYFEENEQKEEADNWLKYGDPWSIRKDDESVIINFNEQIVKAIPYDTPIIGYKSKTINTLRLWKCEDINSFDFEAFNNQEYDKAMLTKNKAEDISRVLYPNDSNKEGKKLRLKQQYFLVSASLQDIILKYKKKFGNITEEFSNYHVIQLNDTHPVLAIPEFIRILVDEEKISFNRALKISKKVFAYTNHTILAEALEKWDNKLIGELLPRILYFIEKIDNEFISELENYNYRLEDINKFKIINNGMIRMANLALYVSFSINGVAALHTKILKEIELNNWYKLYPNKFNNKTNGITPRRWLKLCNKELSSLITKLLGDEKWVKNLELLKGLEKFSENEEVLRKFMDIKYIKKVQLARYIKHIEAVDIDPNSIFDIQIKRLHEYKRQLLNAFYILDLYFRLKENSNLQIPKITFILGGKAFPGYRRAKTIIKFIKDIAKLINNDDEINNKIKVVFITNYRVTYAEKLIPAADISKQISTAGKEASGTGNMKFMLNGAPTFGTNDGANIEIIKASGKNNNFIFGLEVDEINNIRKNYNAKEYYNKDKNLKRVVNTLIDGTFKDNKNNDYRDLYNSLINDGDEYFLMADFNAFKNEEDKVFLAYKNEKEWAKKCFLNLSNAGIFSSDRTIKDYSNDIWKLKKL